jgi:hypothetical protein
MRATGKPDISDAGMAYFLLTQDQHGTPAKLSAYFAELALHKRQAGAGVATMAR